MKTVRPQPLPADAASLRLSPEEGFVLSRIDGRLTVNELVALTGLPATRVEQIVSKLAGAGAVALEGVDSSGYVEPRSSGRVADPSSPRVDDPGATASLADFAAVLGMDPRSFGGGEASAPAADAERPSERMEARSSYPPPVLDDAVPRRPSSAVMRAAEALPVDESPEPAPDGGADAVEASEDAASAVEETEEVLANERNYREIYERRFHALEIDVRVDLAHKASGSDLLALCHDADPRVVSAILENSSSGLDHARMIAQHHRTQTGLEVLSRRRELLKDGLVERRLLRNPQCGEIVLGRIIGPKRLLATYKIAVDRDVPEITRVKGRGHLRQKWTTAPPEERADFILRTEGRCLIFMTGCTFDARATQILCGRPFHSVLLIQNLAKFTATPPTLLAHLAKQPFVRKNPALRKMLLQHPNMPGEAKRNL